jgi:hypothetical protein
MCSPRSESRSTAPSKHSKTITEVLAAHRGELLSLPGVLGVGQGERDGEPCVVVLVERALQLPGELDGYPVSVITTGSITALSP